MSDDEHRVLLSRSGDDETEVKAPPPSADQAGTGSVKQGEHSLQNYLARFVSIIGLFCLVTTGIVLSVGNIEDGDAADNPVDLTQNLHFTPTSPTANSQMEPIGPEKLERFLYIAMIAGLLWMAVALCCPNLLIVQTTNHQACSGQLDKSVLHLLGATLIFAVGAAFLPLINFVAFLSNAKCYRAQVWGHNQSEWLLYQICHFVFIFLQPLFLFKYVQHGAQLRFCRGFSHFAIMWLMGTNISLWFHGLVEESREEGTFELPSAIRPPSGLTNGKTIGPSIVIIPCPASSGLQGVLPEVRPFLHPFALEYSLISAGLFLNLWIRIGKTKVREDESSVEQNDSQPQQAKSLRILVVSGLIVGLIVVLGLVATIVYQSLQLNDLGIKTDICNTTRFETTESTLDTTFGVYYGYSITVSLIVLTGCLIVLIEICRGLESSISWLSGHDPDSDPQHKNHIWIDTALLISSVAGIFLINGFGIAASVGLNNYDGCGTISSWYMTDCIIDTIHCIAQLLLIMWGLHQQWVGTKWRTFVFSCLFIINLGLWGKDLYEVKNIATTALGQVYFGSSVWSVVIHVAFPLCIFFRLHSAATLFPLMMKSCSINNAGN
ncbi:proton channel OtopLc-like [Branchiostoma floridae x Branchiostoma belcheri]